MTAVPECGGWDDPSLWEQHARWWQDEFTDGADPEYEEQILPLVDRHLAGPAGCSTWGAARGRWPGGRPALGADVVGVDPTAAQIVGRQRARRGPELRAAPIADGLPCRDGAFDAVVMCLVIEHLDPFEPAIHEMARVLEPGGRFLLLLNHPLLQTPGSGWIDDHILEEQYWRVGPLPAATTDGRGGRPRGRIALHAPPPEPIRTGDGCRSGC